MNHRVGDYLLRMPEPKDVEALYAQKNDPEIAGLLGGFSTGYSRVDLREWVERHRTRRDEVLWVMADASDDRVVGHVGLYRIDHRVRRADFGIVIGDRDCWGEGLGRDCTLFAIDYGFRELNLNRIAVEVLADNERAHHLYRQIGFVEEGRLRQAQFKRGRYIDVLLMSMLRHERVSDAEPGGAD